MLMFRQSGNLPLQEMDMDMLEVKEALVSLSHTSFCLHQTEDILKLSKQFVLDLHRVMSPAYQSTSDSVTGKNIWVDIGDFFF